MPATMVDDPLGISCVFSNGTAWSWPARMGANPRLGRDLLTGLAALVHPHGRVDSHLTVKHYGLHARVMVDRLAEQGFTGGAGTLTRARLASFWMAAGHRVESSTRAMLTALDEQTPVLRADVRELARGRLFNPHEKSRPLAPYSEGEWRRLQQTCRRVIVESYTAYRRAREDAARGEDPRTGGWRASNVLWLLSRLGPSTAAQVAQHMGLCEHTIQYSRGGVVAANSALFPTTGVTLAYRLLFGAYTGIVPDGIAGLGLGDLDWAGDATVLLSYVKGRTARESLTLPRAAVRLLEQWLDHSALLRGFLPAGRRGDLWPRYVTFSNTGGNIRTDRATRQALTLWTKRHGLFGDDGQPLTLHLHRIRTTFQVMRDRRAWFGSDRATIDPNHTARVEGDHYLSVATPAQRRAVDTLITEAQRDLVRQTRPPVVVLDPDDAAHAAAQLPGLVSGLAGDDTAIAELIGGQRDVFVAACADPLSGLHGPAGKPCPARPWVCLLCPLAVFTTRHAANLLRLKAFFTRQGRQLTSAQFMAVFGPYAVRIEEVLGCFDPAVLAQSASQVTGTDDELPLRPEESTR
jgi:hypothetical protein